MRGKEYLVAIFPERKILRAETMRFEDEIRSPKAIGLERRRYRRRPSKNSKS
jgi:DNA end-binding protein Ku